MDPFVIGKMAEIIERLDRIEIRVRRERVNGVLHGVGRQHLTVVSGQVRRLERALEPHRDREVLELVAIIVALDLDEPHPRLAIAVRAETGHQLPR